MTEYAKKLLVMPNLVRHLTLIREDILKFSKYKSVLLEKIAVSSTAMTKFLKYDKKFVIIAS